MSEMQYAMLTEVLVRWKADVLENFLRSEEIDVVLIQDGVSHSNQQTTFTPVKIYVPRASIPRARNLLRIFDGPWDNTKEM